MDREEALGLAAQAWCADRTSGKVMDTDLAEAFADILLSHFDTLKRELEKKERLIKDIIASNREWLAMFTKDLDEAGKENHALRHILWTSHGCRGCNSVPYMVCNETEHPPIDFISDKPDDILDKLWHKAFDKSKFPPERWNVITTSCADCKLNAQLQAANEELRREVVEGLKEELRVSRTRHMTNFSKANDCNLQLQAELQTERDEVLRLQHWVQDLQKGMYINCVYCGHRYGPNSEVPASMADVLKEHIEQCPKHPMSKLKQQIADLKRRVAGEQELAEAEAREQARIMK